ncbi:MerR family transcriptional regulator [Alicyclobacillus ferrooxydans]|uniref:HTH merR-type domain-containing protein n=1 Tax=Alicyclobacillus ferrooxydans TaxID=471514 RepID=A0A0P9CZB6_9BACL|nr:MerR family transcriptional regulator [Alicyclobacillus ferrooxydans]KPV42398.1 hypothetical protein AN477_17470 [Alicyclobacillus ferrooxydans]
MEWYRIKQVAEQTGLSEQLIRKWEQRYGAVQPRRLDNGYRMYSAADVDRLLAIKQIVDSGTSVSQAVESIGDLRSDAALFEDLTISDVREAIPAQAARRMIEERLQRSGLVTEERLQQSSTLGEHRFSQIGVAAAGMQPAFASDPSEWVKLLIVAGTEGRTRDINQILHRCYVMNGFRAMIHDVIVPFLRTVGVLWEDGSWSEDQEHLSSLSVRDFLVQRMADLPDAPEGAPTLLTSCIPGERHDIMLNIAMLEAKRLGFVTAFLGTEPAPGAIERAVQRLHPTVLLLSATSDRHLVNHPEHQQWLETLDHFAASLPGTRFCLGGPKVIVELCTKALSHIHAVESLPHLFAELEVICGVQVS